MSKAASFAGRIFATALGTKLALSVLGLWFWYNSRVTFASFRPELELEGISIRIGYRVPYWLRIPSPIGKLGGSARIWCECQLDTLDISWSLSSMFSDPACWHGCFTVVLLCFLMNSPWCSCWWRLTSGINHASSRWMSDANRPVASHLGCFKMSPMKTCLRKHRMLNYQKGMFPDSCVQVHLGCCDILRWWICVAEMQVPWRGRNSTAYRTRKPLVCFMTAQAVHSGSFRIYFYQQQHCDWNARMSNIGTWRPAILTLDRNFQKARSHSHWGEDESQLLLFQPWGLGFDL